MDYKSLYKKYKTKFLDLYLSEVIYIKNNEVKPVEIIKEHNDIESIFYTIKFKNGSERQTVKKNLLFREKKKLNNV